MANTVNREGYNISISDIDSDWDFSDNYTEYAFAKGVPIQEIRFNPVATDDKCVIYSSSAASAAPIFYATGADGYDDRVQYYGGLKLRPFLDYSAGTYSSADSVVTILVEPNPGRGR